MENSESCVFCRIVRGKIPASMVYQDDLTLAFMDIGSVNPGHVLVASRAHVENLYAVDDDLAAALMLTATRVARAAKTVLQPQGLCLFQANEAVGGQTVFHVHIHVLPRWEADGMNLSWPARNPPREALEQVAARLRAQL